MGNPNRHYLDGILAATVAVAKVTGALRVNDMTDQTWQVICTINERLADLARAEAQRLEKAR